LFEAGKNIYFMAVIFSTVRQTSKLNIP